MDKIFLKKNLLGTFQELFELDFGPRVIFIIILVNIIIVFRRKSFSNRFVNALLYKQCLNNSLCRDMLRPARSKQALLACQNMSQQSELYKDCL